MGTLRNKISNVNIILFYDAMEQFLASAGGKIHFDPNVIILDRKMREIMNKIEVQEFDTNTMPVKDVILKVTEICKKLGVRHLDLFGSFATGTAMPASDIDFVVYGKVDQFRMEDELEKIETLRNIDIFYFDEIKNEYLKEDIKKYGKCIY